MSNTCLITHLVFSTRNRHPFLRDKILRDDVHAYLGGIIRNLHGTAITIGGVEDHVHMLISLPSRLAIADVVRTVKSNSTTWVHRGGNPSFAWQSEYAAFSVSASSVRAVAAYIDDQDEHHRRRSFQDELILLLQRHGVKYDEKYIRPA